MSKIIRIAVGPRGEQGETTTEGFKGGTACHKASAPYEEIFGQSNVSDVPTPEAAEQQVQFEG